jgi:hypothetical protein
MEFQKIVRERTGGTTGVKILALFFRLVLASERTIIVGDVSRATDNNRHRKKTSRKLRRKARQIATVHMVEVIGDAPCERPIFRIP